MDRSFDSLTDAIRSGYEPNPIMIGVIYIINKFAAGIAIGCGIAVGLAIARAGVGM